MKFVNFIVKIYMPWWVTCCSPADVAEHDIIFLKAAEEYQAIDEQINNSAMKAFSCHLWYQVCNTRTNATLPFFRSVIGS